MNVRGELKKAGDQATFMGNTIKTSPRGFNWMTRISYAEKVIEQLGSVFIALKSSPHWIRAAYSVSHLQTATLNERTNRSNSNWISASAAPSRAHPIRLNDPKVHFTTPVHISVLPCQFFPHARRPILSVSAAPEAWSSTALLDYGSSSMSIFFLYISYVPIICLQLSNASVD